MKWIISLLAVCCTSSSVAQIQQQDVTSTESLLQMCRVTNNNSPDRGYCMGFVTGMANMMEAIGLQGTGDFKKMYGMCVSAPFPSGNAEIQAFINWAEKNPKQWGQSNVVGVILALASTWPCT